jgi:hypothetical protein
MEAGDPGVNAAWAWNWPGQRFDVVAYPSIVFGKKPWSDASTTPLLPKRIAALGCLEADFELNQQAQGSRNLAFDLWVTADPEAAPESIRAEVMIWLSHEGMSSAGRSEQRLEVDGRQVDLRVRDGHPGPDGLSWRYIAFVYPEPWEAGPIDLSAHLDALVEDGYISAEDYLADVELGNEIVSGSGKTTLVNYVVQECKR